MSYLLFSTRIASYLVRKTNLNEEKEEVLAYAIEVLSLNLLNVTLSLLIGYLLGVLPGTLVCLLTVAAIRIFAGGAHSNSPWRCAAITALVFPIMGLIAKKTTIFIQPLAADTFMAVSFLISFAVIYTLAPVDSPSAPIKSKTRRKRLKFFSLSSFAIITFSVALINYSIQSGKELQFYITFGVLWSSFILTPVGHKLFQTIDRLKILNRKE